MQFSFGAPAAVDPAAAPPPAPVTPPAANPAPGQAYKPSFLDILQGVVFDGQSPAEAAMAARSRQYQLMQNQMMLQTLQTATPEQRQAMMLNPAEYGKSVAANYAPQTLAPGSTLQSFGPGGPAATAPVVGLDPISGKTYAAGATSGGATGPSLGGGYKAADGVIMSDRTGPAGAYSTPQALAPGSTPGSFTPTIAGQGMGATPPAGAPAAAMPPMAGPAAAPGAASLPRGIRNNNFGNLKTLPNGQAWDGQSGVDKDGYAIFADPAAGIKAAAQNLNAYATKHNISTVAGVVNRWAPANDGNNTHSYTAYVAGALGVHPEDKINLTDPQVQRKLLGAMFNVENTPQAMKAWRAPSSSPAASGPSPAAPAGGWSLGAPVGQPHIIPPAQAEAQGFAPGAVVEVDAAGKRSVVQSPEYGPEAKSNLRNHVLGSEEYKQAQASLAAYKAMIGNAGTMTGPSAYAMLDTFARAINPGAVARPTVIETIEKNLGLPAQLVGSLDSKFGKGNLPPQVRQQIIDAVVPFAQAHYDQAAALNNANASLAQKHKFDPADVTAPLEGRPERIGVTVPPPQQRAPGLYVTPKGPMKWDGKLWHKAG